MAVLGEASGGRQRPRPGGGPTGPLQGDGELPRNLPHYCSSVGPKIKSAIFNTVLKIESLAYIHQLAFRFLNYVVVSDSGRLQFYFDIKVLKHLFS